MSEQQIQEQMRYIAIAGRLNLIAMVTRVAEQANVAPAAVAISCETALALSCCVDSTEPLQTFVGEVQVLVVAGIPDWFAIPLWTRPLDSTRGAEPIYPVERPVLRQEVVSCANESA